MTAEPPRRMDALAPRGVWGRADEPCLWALWAPWAPGACGGVRMSRAAEPRERLGSRRAPGSVDMTAEPPGRVDAWGRPERLGVYG